MKFFTVEILDRILSLDEGLSKLKFIIDMSSDEEEKPKQRSPKLFLDEPSKTQDALKKFIQLPKCTYQYKYLGDSGQNENMTCDCHEDWNSDLKKNLACGEDSECINRATSVECLNDSCGCGDNCENQRFQRQLYAPVTVIQTEKKGYGLRADNIIHESGFIYEYTGEVINEETFRKRMIDYDQRNFKHFYFMMLKKDSFIDATIKGSLARFVNHSCNPNAYVDKWVVGDKLRMGIFAKRTIRKGEEITFDYNVDRYGAQSQPCYCGEPNCIKFMGGKTQTDAALLLPEGVSDALGVTIQQEKQWLKENKQYRKQQQKDDSTINEAFVNSIQVTPLTEFDVTKVMSSLMKSQDIHVISKLIERIYLTDDVNINLSIVKVHGYKTLSAILQNDKDINNEIIIMILKILNKWPKLTRNKISSSKIEDKIKDLNAKTDDKDIKSLSSQLLDEWLKLQMAYRIPKKANKVNEGSYSRSLRSHSPEYYENRNSDATIINDTTHRNGSSRGSGYNYGNEAIVAETEEEDDDPYDLPEGWQAQFSEEHGIYYYYNTESNITQWEKPKKIEPVLPNIQPQNVRPELSDLRLERSDRQDRTPNYNELRLAQLEEERLQREKQLQHEQILSKQKYLQELILQSQKENEEKKLLEAKIKQELFAKDQSKERSKHKSKKSSSKPVNIEKLWSTVFAKYVPNFIKKYESEIGRDNLKGCARDIVKLLSEKEINKNSNKSPPEELDNVKIKKIKDFTKGYMEKFLIKYRSKHRRDEISNEPKRIK